MPRANAAAATAIRMTHAEYLASESTAEIKLVSDDDDWILGRITAVQQGLSRMGSGQE